MEVVLKGKKVTSEDVLMYKPNPKREGSMAHGRYGAYEEVETLEAYFECAEKKFARADLRFDWEHGHLAVNGERYVDPQAKPAQ